MKPKIYDGIIKLRLTPELDSRIRQKAAESEQTVSEYLRVVMRSHLDQQEGVAA